MDLQSMSRRHPVVDGNREDHRHSWSQSNQSVANLGICVWSSSGEEEAIWHVHDQLPSDCRGECIVRRLAHGSGQIPLDEATGLPVDPKMVNDIIEVELMFTRKTAGLS